MVISNVVETLVMTSEGLGEMFESEFGDTCTNKIPLLLMGSRAEGLMCANPRVRTPISTSGITVIADFGSQRTNTELYFCKVVLFCLVEKEDGTLDYRNRQPTRPNLDNSTLPHLACPVHTVIENVQNCLPKCIFVRDIANAVARSQIKI